MAHTNSWDETTPSNSTLATSIDDEIRKLRQDCRERLAVDHYFTSADSGEAERGMHKQITFYDDVTAPSVSGDQSAIYPAKLGSTIVVPFFKNASSSSRLLLGDANCKVWMYSATAPVGWEAAASPPSDCVLAAVGGATYTTAGATAGTWTISGITVPDHAAHNHKWYEYSAGYGVIPSFGSFDPSSHTWNSGGSPILWNASTDGYTDNEAAMSHTPSHSGAWRISAAVNKLYSPDLT